MGKQSGSGFSSLDVKPVVLGTLRDNGFTRRLGPEAKLVAETSAHGGVTGRVDVSCLGVIHARIITEDILWPALSFC